MTCLKNIRSKKSLAALLCTALVAFITFDSSASAKDPELSFYASGEWVSVQGDQCSVSGEFNNGFILGFHGDKNGLESLSIDFRQDAFDPGKVYEVSLSIPGFVNETVSASASSSQILNADLRGHDGVLYAVKKSSLLDVNVEENSFRFYMVGFNESDGGYMDCMNEKTGAPMGADGAGDNIVVSTNQKTPPSTPPGEIKYVMKSDDRSALEEMGIPKDSNIKVDKEEYTVTADFTGMDEESLRAQNAALKNELEAAIKESKQEEMSIRADNWDLERATMRYNEAELQIKTLGQKLAAERAQCTMEKKKLEAMLFDPQVTEAQQQAKLADLQEKLVKAQKELELQRMRYDERIKVLEQQIAQ